MSTSAPEDARWAELVRLSHFWRQRYLVEAFSTFNLASRVLNSDEIALVGDPVFWQGTSKDVNAALLVNTLAERSDQVSVNIGETILS
jgi:hypothetical protein